MTTEKGAPSLSALPPSLAAAVNDACASVSHNLQGQKLGKKGRTTRERIIAAALELIDAAEEPVTLSAVARRAGLGMTSLYNYFTDISELLVAVLEPVMASAEESYLSLLRVYWTDAELFDRCYDFVRGYHDFWAHHARLLHLRNALADQQDVKMIQHRIYSTRPVIRLLLGQMGYENEGSSPYASMATMMMIGIERTVSLSTDRELRRLVRIADALEEDRYLVPGARLMELAIRDARSGKDWPRQPGALIE